MSITDAVTIPDYENYKIDRFGTVYKKPNKEITLFEDSSGYLCCQLRGDKPGTTTRRKRIGFLLALAFVPNPNNFRQVKHLNGNRYDISIENLGWTNEMVDNEAHEVPEDARLKILKLKRQGKNNRDISRECGWNIRTVKKVVTDET